MSPILTGVIASGISGHLTPPWEPQGAYDALSTVTVPLGGIASITFAGIPTGYKHLQIRFMGITSRPTYAIDGLNLNLNADFGANYTLHNISGNGGGGTPGAGGGGGYSSVYMDFVLGTTVANYPGLGVIDIYDYANVNKNKVVRALGGSDSNGTSVASTPGRVNFASAMWINTSAINTLTFTPVNNNFSQYTNFALHGVK
jgi:hypothetical protein